MQIILGAAIILVSLILIFLVISQKSRDEGLGASFGDVGGFEGTRGDSMDVILRRWTRVFAVVFAILVIVANIFFYVMSK